MVELGRHTALKMRRSQDHEGSIPSVGTNWFITYIYVMLISLRDLKKFLISEIDVSVLRQKYSNIPEYVFHDLYRGRDEKFFVQLNNLKWELQILHVNPNDFSPETQQKFNSRGFGDINIASVFDDQTRTNLQRNLAKSDGSNEPIVVVKAVDGYRLWEGWHRTMAILRLGNNGQIPPLWNKVQIKAWVGMR